MLMVVHQSFGGTSRLHWRSPSMAVEFYFTPELHLRDGRVIRDLEDAISFAREQEARNCACALETSVTRMMPARHRGSHRMNLALRC